MNRAKSSPFIECENKKITLASDKGKQPGKSTDLTWEKATKNVLSSSTIPLGYREIADQIVSKGLCRNSKWDPVKAVGTTVRSSINRDKDSSPFIFVGRGIVALRTHASEKTVLAEKSTPEATESGESEKQYEIVTSFGMFWDKEDIEWTPKPKLLGTRANDAIKTVDFCEQQGIYLLYDGREVIYVGRTTDTLGKRLYEHTRDRMSARWDRFSWFGFLKVSNGKIIGQLSTYSTEKLIPALEAILIEALEPRQNRKRGDDLEAVEYIQKIDPRIAKKRVLEVLNNLELIKENS